jgi:hypothetical protein
MAVDWSDNKLTPEIKAKLKQGTKVKFMWHGNSSLVYNGRIEISDNRPYWVHESCYSGDNLVQPQMRLYNPLDNFFHFTMFEILN